MLDSNPNPSACANGIHRVGVDLAKNVIQVHAVDGGGKVITNRPVAREKFLAWCSAQLPPGCRIALEATCSAHHWARQLQLRGFDVCIIAAHLVQPYRVQGKSGKNDANDAAAICEAASRPHMHFVPLKSADQQSMLCIHRLREGFKQERTACINRLRGLVAEFGIVFPASPRHLSAGLHEAMEDASNELCTMARLAVQRGLQQWQELDAHLAWCNQRIAAHRQGDERVRRAQQLIGVGPVGASAAIATVGDFTQFKSAHQFGAWLGLVPRQNSSGGKSHLGAITKRGDAYLRTLLIQGAKSAVHNAHLRDDPISQWVCKLKERAGWQKAATALANKNARILWAIFAKGVVFDAGHVSVMPGRPAAAAPL